MNRGNLSCLVLLLSGLVLAVSGCASTQGGAAVKAGGVTSGERSNMPKFVHAVFFVCKPGTPDSEIDALVNDAYALLARVPSVRQIQSGRRDTRMMRDVNDKEYTVGLLVLFDDKAGHDLYSDHPLHNEYVAKHKEHWASVRVCDFTGK